MPRKLKGIRRRSGGWRVDVRVNGKLYTKQFPLDTAIEDMRTWRDDRSINRERKDSLALLYPAPSKVQQRLPRSERTWCYIYFARSEAIVKIGRSVDPAQRIREIQTMHPGELTLLVSVAAHAALEHAIHHRFAHLRTRADGEWFRLAPDLVAFIRALQNGANPVALLFEDESIPPCPAS